MRVVDAPLGVLDKPDPDRVAVVVPSGEHARDTHHDKGSDDQRRDDHAHHVRSLDRQPAGAGNASVRRVGLLMGLRGTLLLIVIAALGIATPAAAAPTATPTKQALDKLVADGVPGAIALEAPQREGDA